MSFNSTDVRLIEKSRKKKRKIVTPEGRAVIVNVYKFLKVEYLFTMMHKDCKCDLSHLRNIARRTADATNVTLRTVEQALAENRQTNTEGVDKNQYKFKKAKPFMYVMPETEAEKLRQELELSEAANLAEINDEDLSDGTDETILKPVKVKEEVDDNTTLIWQPAEIKEEAEVKTEVEKEDTLEEIDITEEASDYEITIEEECIY